MWAVVGVARWPLADVPQPRIYNTFLFIRWEFSITCFVILRLFVNRLETRVNRFDGGNCCGAVYKLRV